MLNNGINSGTVGSHCIDKLVQPCMPCPNSHPSGQLVLHRRHEIVRCAGVEIVNKTALARILGRLFQEGLYTICVHGFESVIGHFIQLVSCSVGGTIREMTTSIALFQHL